MNLPPKVIVVVPMAAAIVVFFWSLDRIRKERIARPMVPAPPRATPRELVERLLYGCDEAQLHVRIDSPLGPEQLAGEGVGFWLYLSGAAGGDEIGETFATPLRPGSIGDLGFEPGTVVRVVGGELTVARLNEGRTGAVPVARDTFIQSSVWERTLR